jgi:amino acid adenylation domain-containing protein
MSQRSPSTPRVSPPGLALRTLRHPAPPLYVPFSAEDVESSLPARFERQAELHSQRVAVQTQRQTLTYSALNQAANRVAHSVVKRVGVGHGRVGLLFDYDTQLIVGLLGTLKAGKTYMPMEASYPRERSSFMLEDSQAELMLTDNKYYSAALQLVGGSLPVINIEKLAEDSPFDNVSLAVEPDSPAYMIYTSGSTGYPKAVVQTNRNVLHCMMWYTDRLYINATDRLSLTSPITYAYAIVPIFAALLNGAALLPCNVRELGADILGPWLQRECISIHHTVAAVFRHFARRLSDGDAFPSLRLLCIGGDVTYRADFELYAKRFPETCVFLHELGMAEALICCALLLGKDADLAGSTVPAGYPGDDLEVLILGEDGRDLGAGQVGQIAIKSRYLTPGYWRRPELTDAAFRPASADGSERIYLTGDLGRIRPDGCLEYIGRSDFRVKLRGQTIEVAEIETALLSVPVVKEAAVVAREDHPGESYLAAYITVYPGKVPTADELRSLLLQKLPAHMIPRTFLLLDAMPLSANGKVDRRALLAVEGTRLGQARAFVPPRTSVEEAVAAAWKEVLQLDAIGIYDDFFELGGDSLSAGRVITQVYGALGIEVPLGRFFEAPTIAQLAEAIQQIQRGGQGGQQPTLAKIPREAHRVKRS